MSWGSLGVGRHALGCSRASGPFPCDNPVIVSFVTPSSSVFSCGDNCNNFELKKFDVLGFSPYVNVYRKIFNIN